MLLRLTIARLTSNKAWGTARLGAAANFRLAAAELVFLGNLGFLGKSRGSR